MIMRLGFAANLEKPGVDAHRDAMMRCAEAQGFECRYFECAEQIDDAPVKPDCLVVIGGDGSLLRFARPAADAGIPILGVNLGRIGFLSEIVASEFPEALRRLRDGAYAIKERMMLSARINDEAAQNCLNDVLVFKHSFSGVAEVAVTVVDMRVGNVFCDGIVAATPTGATGYSLSAGGPVVAEGLDSIVVTPVCSHTLHIRPIVSAPEAVWTFSVIGKGVVALDGVRTREVSTGDVVRVTRADKRAGFIRLSEKNVFELIEEKLG